MTDEQKPEDKKGELALADVQQFFVAIGALINPLAKSQAEAQIEAIHAQDRQHERVIQAMDKDGQRRFWVSLAFGLALTAVIVVVLAITQRAEPAFYALTYLGGAISGYGYARVKFPGAGQQASG